MKRDGRLQLSDGSRSHELPASPAAKSLGQLTRARLGVAAGLVALGVAHAAAACPYCFGDASSDQVKGAKAGVAFLLVVVVGLLVAIANIARTWAKRAAALDAAEQARSAGHGMPAGASAASGSAPAAASAGPAISPRAVPAAPQT